MNTKIIRFDDEGFKIKLYASTRSEYGHNAYYNKGSFIDYEIDEFCLGNKDIVLNESKEILFKPRRNDIKWNGCFVFIESFNSENILETLHFRSNDLMNCGEIIDDNMLIWAKNWNYKREILIREFRYIHSSNTIGISESFHGDTAWVKMSLKTFKIRMRKASEYYACNINQLPEELLECYFMEQQVKQLKNIVTSRYDHINNKEVKKNKLTTLLKNLFNH